MTGRIAILSACAVGFYASAFMYRKALLAARGALTEPSVVETPRARAIGGVPNAAFGIAYYPLVALAMIWFHVTGVWALTVAASFAAAAFSLYLAYSLLFVTKRWCPYCWLSHLVNWTLPFLLFAAKGE
ncbi:MAG TPA: vitamin K epoxide reductase family protein [Candidatus Binatia bacterium]|nr:vitamin K epoxide reductase family protein [Candidatus Binatia bacterium]